MSQIYTNFSKSKCFKSILRITFFYFTFLFSTIDFEIFFKHKGKLKDQYNEHSYTHHLDSTTVTVSWFLIAMRQFVCVCVCYSQARFKICWFWLILRIIQTKRVPLISAYMHVEKKKKRSVEPSVSSISISSIFNVRNLLHLLIPISIPIFCKFYLLLSFHLLLYRLLRVDHYASLNTGFCH